MIRGKYHIEASPVVSGKKGLPPQERAERFARNWLAPWWLLLGAALGVAGTAAAQEEEVDWKKCSRAMEEVGKELSRGVQDEEDQQYFDAVAAGFNFMTDDPVDVRQWFTGTGKQSAEYHAQQLKLHCNNPEGEADVQVKVGGKVRLLLVTLRPRLSGEPPKEGKVELIEVPPKKAEDSD